MPGFTLTLILLCLAGAWSRYLSNRIDHRWPMVLPGVAIGIWCLSLVGGIIAAMGFVPGESGALSLEALLIASDVSWWTTMVVLVGMIPVTIAAWRQPVAS